MTENKDKLPIETARERIDSELTANTMQDSEATAKQLERLQKLSKLLDNQYRIPGTPIRFGWDAILGLVPIAGDVVGFALSAWLVQQAIRAGAPRFLIVEMLGNLGIELVGGSIPVIGDAFDIYWKSNIKNIELLEQYLLKELEPELPAPPPKGRKKPSKWLVMSLILVVTVATAIYILSTPNLLG